MKSLKTIVSFLYTLSVSTVLDEAIGLVCSKISIGVPDL